MTVIQRSMLSGLLFTVFSLNSAFAETHTVEAVGMAYKPLVIKVAPGDTVSWTNMNTHNIEAVEGMVPEGSEIFMSKMSENFTHTFEQAGIYIYKCTPHIGAGMGGAVIVGEPKNLDEIKAVDASGGVGRIVKKAISAAESM